MIERFKIYEKRLKEVLSPSRFEHSLRVVETSLEFAKNIKIDESKLVLAALIHDRCKEFPKDNLIKICVDSGRILNLAEKVNPDILHGPAGAIIIKGEWGIKDKEVLRAVEYHTTAAPYMSLIEKIIYLADTLEPARDHKGVNELRRLAKENLNSAYKLTLDYTIQHVLEKGSALHPYTVEARNSILYERKIGGY